MASVFPTGNYFTKSVALSTNSKTTIYTCGDQQEVAADVTGIVCVASDGNADTVSVIRYQSSDTTEYMLVYHGAVEADYPLQIEGLPIHLGPGDAIKATASNAATHAVHVHISVNLTTRSPKKD